MKMTNGGNKIIYRLWAPLYDAVVGGFFLPGRKRSLEVLDLQPGERVLLIGIGTGADLPLLPEGVEAIGVDLSPDMLARARAKLPLPGRTVKLLEGDAQSALFEEKSFDAVILNLILSVIPDGRICLKMAMQALKDGGRAVIFDKFAPEGKSPSIVRKILNWFSTLFGTDITRRFGEIFVGCSGEVIREEASILKGMYRIILLRKIPPRVSVL